MPHRTKQYLKYSWLTLNPKLTTFLFFIFLVVVISLLGFQRYQIVKENREKEINIKLENIELRINQLIKSSQNAVLTIALTLDNKGQPKDFERIAAEIMQSNSAFKAVQLVPNGVIKYVYPIQGNEKAIGLNLFKQGLNSLEANKAVKLGKMYFQGPVELAQGSKGVIGRLPLYIGGKFWGFSAVVIKLDELLKVAGIAKDSTQHYKFQFSKINPVTKKEEFFLKGSQGFNASTHKTKIIEEGDWKIYLTDNRPIYADFQLGYLVVFGVLISLLSSYLLLRLLKKQAQLHSILYQQHDMLLVAENKYKAIFDHAAIGIGRVASTTGEFLEANSFLCELLGYSSDELTNKKIKTLIHPDDLAADRHNFKKLLANQIRQFSSVRRYIHKNGSVIWASAIVSPLWTVGENPSQHIVIIEDITKQVAYEEKLIASQKHVEELINSIQGIVWEASIKDNFASTFVSGKVFDILGYSVKEWSETKGFFLHKIHPDDKQRTVNYLNNELFSKKYHEYEYRILNKNGETIWIRDSVTVLPSIEAPEKLIGIMMDITAIKEAEETLRKSYELVNEQNKRLLNFSYIVSHNLRSHASNIDGISSLINNAETVEERDEMIKLLRRVVVNLNDTLYNLNKIVNIQTSIDLVTEPLNLLEYIHSAIATQEAKILNKNAHVNVSVSEDITVNFNRAYLESVLLNLISNALRYCDPLRTPLIEINGETNTTGYVLRIKDNGVGIDLVKNGEKLFGLNQTFYGNSDARGFGLFITKNQIEAMGGKIEVESVLGKGTTFTVYFY